jgi:two-component system CheB/CheR fusion protein
MGADAVTDEGISEQFEDLLEYVRENRGFDFTGYKRPSLVRRFGKRMQEVRIDGYAAYRAYLERHPEEFVNLFNTILINVTGFFRDQVTWDYVNSELIPRIVESRAPGDPLRAWSAGCATGEEAYTLAMLFAEALGEEAFRQRVKIYATDVDEEALAVGRQAIYTPKQVEPVPAELRERYFERNGDSNYLFRNDLRRSVIFGRQDLIQDPPISRIDLLVSRNTLMYFTAKTQVRILDAFYFALRGDGYVLLGKSEVLIRRSPLFVAVDVKRRVFARASSENEEERPPRVRVPQADTEGVDVYVREAALDAAPVAQIVVNRRGELTGANMQARTLFGLVQRELGQPLKDFEVSYRPLELRSRLEEAYEKRHAVTVRDVELEAGSDGPHFMDVQIAPLMAANGELMGAGITFTDVTRFRALESSLQRSSIEMENAYEELQSTVEELETTNEELQSTNEELETMNEELQSTNEELETMNEELQSTNEELETMNDELNLRTDEVNEVNAFLDSILGSLGAGVAVLDGELQVRAWNRGAQNLWGLRSEEVLGRHFMNLDIGLPVERLGGELRGVLSQDAGPIDITVPAVDRRGRSIECAVRISPMRDWGDARRGAIVMMNAHVPEASS